MALIRPVVLVYQEFANQTVTAAEPELNCLVVGPCYQIRDYYVPGTTTASADKSSIVAGSYGTLEAVPAGSPVTSTSYAIPDVKDGAVVDADSVAVYLDEARVIVTSGTQALTTGGSNSITFGAGDAVNITTGTNKVLPGDRIVFTDANNVSLWGTVQAVTGTKALLLTTDIATGNRKWTFPGQTFIASGVGPGYKLVVTDDVNNVSRNDTYTVSQVLSQTTVIVNETILGNTGDTANVTLNVFQPNGTTQVGQQAFVASAVSGTVFTASSPAANQAWRIERKILDHSVSSASVTVSGNAVTVAGNLTAEVNGASKTISYGKVYVAYRALRTDSAVQDVITVQGQSDIFGLNGIDGPLGRLDARNPLAVGLYVALQNTTTSVKGYGIGADSYTGYTAVLDAIAPRDDIYALVPLTTDLGVIKAYNDDCYQLALPDEGTGRPQRFRVVIGSGTLPTTKTVADVATSATALKESGTGSGVVRILSFDPGTLGMVAGGVRPGYKIIITNDANGVSRNSPAGGYTITHVVDDDTVVVAETVAAAVALNAAVKVTVEITTAAGGNVFGPQNNKNMGSAITEDLRTILQDSSATFVSAGIKAGDKIHIPVTPTTNNFTTYLTYTVSSVLSENRLKITNNGYDTATVANELPYGVSRGTATVAPALVTTGAMVYRIVRTLSKSQQVTSLVADAQSFSSRRTILVWPDKCDVNGVTGGLEQPGYYMACAVGGMTAGLPPHQGFTFLGIAGIGTIKNANTYFSDTQLTELMQGGWYVFSQSTPTSLPFTIHQLTTDPSTIENGEYSVVKNYDYVSLYFVEILSGFLGKYNVTPMTLGFIRSALANGIDTLRLRSLPRIGAPLLSGSIANLGVSDQSSDRIKATLNIGLPKPLNVIELHLVA